MNRNALSQSKRVDPSDWARDGSISSAGRRGSAHPPTSPRSFPRRGSSSSSSRRPAGWQPVPPQAGRGRRRRPSPEDKASMPAPSTPATSRSVTDGRARHGRHGRHDGHGPRRRASRGAPQTKATTRAPAGSAHPHRRGFLRRRLQAALPRRLQPSAVAPKGDEATLMHPVHRLRAMSYADVQKAVDFARTRNIELTVINSGHDFLGRAATAPSGAEDLDVACGRDDGLGGVHADGREARPAASRTSSCPRRGSRRR